MALLDISIITRAVINVIKTGFDSSSAWTGNLNTPDVLPDPPDRKDKEGVGFYLYHIQENTHYKNMPPLGNDNAPVKFIPMALNLYYQLSANDKSDDGTSAFTEQTMMSVAMKALHDYPEINDTTTIAFKDRVNLNNIVAEVLPNLLRGNNRFRVRITLQSLAASEALQFWTAEKSPNKLAAYYEVSVVFLEPEPPNALSGRVLAYGVNVFTEGAPQIMSSQSIITFSIPGEVDKRQITAQPAQAATKNRLTLFGTGFNGHSLEVLILNKRWETPAIIKLSDPNWKVQLKAANELSLEVQEKVDPALVPNVLPGMYAAQIRVSREIKLPNDKIRLIEHLSNQSPFIVTPRLDIVNDLITTPLGSTITINGHGFQDAQLPESAIQIYVGSQQYTASSGNTPKTFNIKSLTTFDLTLEDTSSVKGQTLPLRVIIAGAESAPKWITIT